jgi:hypothetical protein
MNFHILYTTAFLYIIYNVVGGEERGLFCSSHSVHKGEE